MIENIYKIYINLHDIKLTNVLDIKMNLLICNWFFNKLNKYNKQKPNSFILTKLSI